MTRMDSAARPASPTPRGRISQSLPSIGIGRFVSLATYSATAFRASRSPIPWFATYKTMTNSHRSPTIDAQLQVSIGPVTKEDLALLLLETEVIDLLFLAPRIDLTLVDGERAISINCLNVPIGTRQPVKCGKCNRTGHNRRTCTYKRRLA